MNLPSHRRALHILIFCACVLLVSCGKKASPSVRLPEIPPPVTAFSAVHRDGLIRLEWIRPAEKDPSVGTLMVMKSSGNAFETIAELDPKETSYTDRDIQFSTGYSYRIRSMSRKNDAVSDSAVISLTPLPPPSPPSGVTHEIADNKIVLRWHPPSGGILFNVYRSTGENPGASWKPAHPQPLTEPFFEDGSSPDRTVQYVIRSLFNAVTRDEGPASDVISLSPRDFIPAAPGHAGYYSAPGKIFLFWEEAREPWTRGYRIYRKTGDAPYALLGESQIPVFIDMHPAGSPASYRITAAGPEFEGPFTELNEVIPGPASAPE